MEMLREILGVEGYACTVAHHTSICPSSRPAVLLCFCKIMVGLWKAHVQCWCRELGTWYRVEMSAAPVACLLVERLRTPQENMGLEEKAEEEDWGQSHEEEAVQQGQT